MRCSMFYLIVLSGILSSSHDFLSYCAEHWKFSACIPKYRAVTLCLKPLNINCIILNLLLWEVRADSLLYSSSVCTASWHIFYCKLSWLHSVCEPKKDHQTVIWWAMLTLREILDQVMFWIMHSVCLRYFFPTLVEALVVCPSS